MLGGSSTAPPGMLTHAPLTHMPLQARLQPPQWAVLVIVSTQAFAHSICPAVEQPQTPPLQTEPAGHALPQAPHRRALRGANIGAVEDHRARIGLDKPQHGACDGRLAAAGLAHKAQRHALGNCKRDIVDGADDLGPRGEHPAADREGLGEVADFKGAIAGRWNHAPAPAASRTGQRTRWEGPAKSPDSCSAGRISAQLGSLCGQRGA